MRVKSTVVKAAAAVAAAVALVLAGGVPANAAAIYSKVSCTGTFQYPHYSSGAGGAIAKVDVTCKGSGMSVVKVRVRGLLSFAPSSSSKNTKVTFSTRAQSDQTQVVGVGGTKITYYIPQVGKNGGRGTGFWRATATWQIVSPGAGTVGSDTVTIWKAI
jgi:hypothetical protein